MLDIAVIYLAAALIAVPLAKRLGLGSVLGYLLAGILIGPFILRLVDDQTDVMHFAEFGVVMMLFLVGLELQPSRLWKLRHAVAGLGGLQVALTTFAIFCVCIFVFALRWQTSLAIGLMLALSSTAIVIQTLNEKGWIKLQAGENSFAVLLFQDIAVIPILALVPLLVFAAPQDIQSEESHANLIAHLPTYIQTVISCGVIVAIILAGKYLVSPVFRRIIETRLNELFTVFSLFLVIVIAVIMQKIGLSPALGTFLAGVVLAESEFRHEFEANIAPFKGLLLGLFFITVGASIDFGLFAHEYKLVVALVAGLIFVKAAILYLLAILFRFQKKQRLLFAFALAQGGEFAFVLLSLTSSLQILSPELTKMITLVVAISMLLAPILLMFYERVIDKEDTEVTEKAFDKAEDIEAAKNVIIVGYGRFGQIIGRLLTAQGYHLSILDHDSSHINLLKRFGNKVFYGDGSRLDLLEAAGAREAELLVIAIDDGDKIIDIIKLARKHFPNLQLVCRSTERRHAFELIKMGVSHFRRETFHSALKLGIDSLMLLGRSQEDAESAGKIFMEHDIETLRVLADVWGDDENYGIVVEQRVADLHQILQQDRNIDRESKKRAE
jgi:glutathione-regulated potassium-efflux system ancillary protein KefC/glutathione-regulated potassium-efflux system protein KefB